MFGNKTNRLTIIIIFLLVISLTTISYLYYDSILDNSELISEREQIVTELSSLIERYSGISEQMQALSGSNDDLARRISELEVELSQSNFTQPEIILDVNGSGEVRNVILLIGDGMGVGQISVAEFENGNETLAINSLPYMSLISTYSLSSFVTDSAASATALATGYKTNNGMVSKSPDGISLRSIVEVAEDNGLSTGVITTTRVTHATPACFLAHVNSRDQENLIAQQVLTSGVEVILGGGSSYFSSLDPSSYGYTVVETVGDLMDIESGKVLGLFSAGYMSYDSVRNPLVEPSLAEMTRKSIELLSDDPDGFFLMVEGGRIDLASHANDYENTLCETLAFDLAVLEALKFASFRNDTLVLVTADHETGGLMISGGYSSGGVVYYDWGSDDHTGNMVPIYGFGPMAEEIMKFSDNTDVGKFIIDLIN
jgi:alkaline phosphatase